ncbi:MAG: gliding motility-associated C-terminal domain-containing protein, partial [Bacteroidales bacterium]|nr:gliding motility-associated C-terminal domain-containing protein [Bacteroidales bacterium]
GITLAEYLALTGAAAADNCNIASVTYQDRQSGSCPIVVTRTWRITDNCGNAATVSQTIYIDDTTPPTFTVPNDTVICRSLDCSYNINTSITGDVTDEADNCDTSLDAVYSDDISGASDCSNLGLVVRTWTLTDNCGNMTTRTQNIWIEPVVTISAKEDTLCDGYQTNIFVESNNTTFYGTRYTWTVVDNPEVLGETNSSGYGQMIGTAIENNLDNTSDRPQVVKYTITPWTIDINGDNKCNGIPIAINIWVNPTPRIVPSITAQRICTGDATEVKITSPTVMTHGELRFDYTVSLTGVPGDLTGDTNPQNDLIKGDIISFNYENHSDTVQSVNYHILPRSVGTGCPAGLIETAEVKVHPLPVLDLIDSNPLTCDSNNDLELTAVVAKGTGPLEIIWDGGPATFDPEAHYNDTVISDLKGGFYIVTVRDFLGCVNTVSGEFFESPPAVAFTTEYKPPLYRYTISCPGGNDGEIQINCWNGPSFPYYYWVVKNNQDTIRIDTLFNTSDFDYITGLGEGTYDWILKDDNDCRYYSTTPLILEAPDSIDVTYEISDYLGYNISCKGYSDGEISVVDITGGNGNYSYFWYTFDGFISGDNTLDHLSNIPAGTYYLEITDILGCQRMDTFLIIEPDGITLESYDLSLSPDGNYNISCYGGNDGFITLNFGGGSGEYSYIWTGPEGAALQINEKDQQGLIAGTYNLVVTDANGCTMPFEFILTEPDSLEIVMEPTYTFDFTYNINCYGGTGDIDITVSGGSPAGYTYEWSSPDGTGLVPDAQDQTGLTSGMYIVKVTDLNECILIDSITLSEPPPLSVEHEVTNITCASPGRDNGSITLTVQGGAQSYSYLWSNGATTRDISGLTEGWYYVTITDDYGCTLEDSSYVALPPPLEFNKDTSDYNGYNISCYNKNDGFINITMTSGQEPFIYTWTGPDGFISNTSSISNLYAGEYILLVEDNNYCTVTDTTILTQPDSLMMNLAISASNDGGYNINCYGDSTGSIEILPVNNVGYVDFFWTDGYMQSVRTSIPAGTYGVMIVDDNYCSADTVITLTQPDPIIISAEIIQPYCKDLPDGEITIHASGGIPEYSYLWFDNSASTYRDNVTAGEYRVTVTDNNGCSVTETIIVTSEREVCITIPNAISPNGDNINDYWNIDLIELYPEAEIRIFNRWGELVWASEKGYPQPWDGTSNGRKLPVDSYHYIINLHDGTRPVIGDVTIIR